MTQTICPVKEIDDQLREVITSGRLPQAWARQRAKEVLTLLDDLVQGRGRPEHIPAIASLARTMIEEGPDEAGRKTGRHIIDTLERHQEVFLSHAQTHHCAQGHCLKLTPAPCQMACPAGIDIPSYVTLIGQGRDAEAIELIRQDNPFPWVCGLICTNPCELMCVRGRLDKPISIKFMKAFAAERAMSHFRYVNPPQAPDTHRRVCIIGAGPAGLSAAYYLALKGHRVTVIEGLSVAGGMMMVGIPRYRLPREVIDREVALIEELGVDFRFNTYLGHDVTIEDLEAEGFEAIFLAMGAHAGLHLNIRGENEFHPVVSAIEFLREVALGDRHLPGRRIAVIGGGNVAIDAARTALRLGAQEVYLVYRRTRSEMPANPEEVEQAEEEGIRLSFLTMPLEIVGRNKKVTGLKCLRTELGPPDESGRRRPAPIDGSDYVLEIDAVIAAIGQAIHPGGLTPIKGLRWSRRGTILVDTASMATSIAGLFAAGDLVTGPATVIEAIGGGKKAAVAIDRYLAGLPQPKLPPVPVRRAKLPPFEVEATAKMTRQRPPMALLGLDRRRVTFQQVELGLTEEAVRAEARRCLRCDVCIRCGTCVKVCRDQMAIDALKFGFLSFDHPTPTDFRLTAERCIACGACANNCPSGAMTITDQDGVRRLTLCGTVLNRLKVEFCRECGAVLDPMRYQDYINRRTKDIAEKIGSPALCFSCARLKAAHDQSEISALSKTPPPPRGDRP